MTGIHGAIILPVDSWAATVDLWHGWPHCCFSWKRLRPAWFFYYCEALTLYENSTALLGFSISLRACTIHRSVTYGMVATLVDECNERWEGSGGWLAFFLGCVSNFENVLRCVSFVWWVIVDWLPLRHWNRFVQSCLTCRARQNSPSKWRPSKGTCMWWKMKIIFFVSHHVWYMIPCGRFCCLWLLHLDWFAQSLLTCDSFLSNCATSRNCQKMRLTEEASVTLITSRLHDVSK